MDYEKKYKEVLKKTKKELQACGSDNCDAARQIYRFFPELKEVEKVEFTGRFQKPDWYAEAEK